MEAMTTEAGETVYVNREKGERGSKGPFYAVYRTDAGDRRWGYFCSNCSTFDNAMDSMGRIECNECGNIRKPEGWDDAHE